MKRFIIFLFVLFVLLGCDTFFGSGGTDGTAQLVIEGTITSKMNFSSSPPSVISYSHESGRDFVLVADYGSNTELDRDDSDDVQLSLSATEPPTEVLQTTDEYNSTLTYSSDTVQIVEVQIRTTDISGSLTDGRIVFSTWDYSQDQGRLLRYLYVTEAVSITGTGVKRQSTASAEWNVTLEQGWNTVHEAVNTLSGDIVVTEADIADGLWTYFE